MLSLVEKVSQIREERACQDRQRQRLAQQKSDLVDEIVQRIEAWLGLKDLEKQGVSIARYCPRVIRSGTSALEVDFQVQLSATWNYLEVTQLIEVSYGGRLVLVPYEDDSHNALKWIEEDVNAGLRLKTGTNRCPVDCCTPEEASAFVVNELALALVKMEEQVSQEERGREEVCPF